MNRSIYAHIGIAALLLNTATPPALANEEVKPDTVTLGTAIPDAQLSENRGGYTLELNTNSLSATLNDNTATNNVTGSNYINGGAFSGASGLPTVIQNSGNNVLIQNATILNVKMQ